MQISDRKYEKLINALAFYANPDSYFAIGFFEDRPCGEFMDDFSMADDWCEYPYHREMPGKLARQTLREIGFFNES